MEAMPGKRSWGGGRQDFIPDQHKEKVYGQVSDILLELYSHPFDKIGMLWNSEDDGVHVDAIHDQHFRLKPYGPFKTSLEFSKLRAEKLADFRGRKCPKAVIPATHFRPEDIPDTCRLLLDPEHLQGPFYLAHPDFQVSNFLFDDDFNITALLDWSGCQTVPLKSFAHPPMNVIPVANEFLEYFAQIGLLSDEMRRLWSERRRSFLEILEEKEIKLFGMANITNMMRSPRSYFAVRYLDREGIIGEAVCMPKECFERFCISIGEKYALKE